MLAKLAGLKDQVKPITEFLSNDEQVKMLKQDRTQNMVFLQNEFNIGAEEVDALYNYAKWNFECGNYAAAGEYLYHFRSLSTHPEKNTSALWGKVATDILLQDYDSGMDDIMKLKELLENDAFAPVPRQLQQKAWLMHWSLFVFFNHENGMNALIDLFMQDRYTTAMDHTPEATHQCHYNDTQYSVYDCDSTVLINIHLRMCLQIYSCTCHRIADDYIQEKELYHGSFALLCF